MLAATESAPLRAVDTRHERHGRDEIIITTYALTDGGYTYSVQCSLGRFVRATYPHQHRENVRKENIHARAVSLLREWTRHSRAAQTRLRNFALLSVGQREFDFGI